MFREASNLRKAAFLLLIFILPIATISLLNPHNACAAFPEMVQVEKIDHIVEPIYGGLVVINDTVRIAPTAPNTTIESFSIGFPIEYRTNLRFALAYNAEDSGEQLDTILDTGLGVTGYYGLTVVFPTEVRTLLYDGQSYTFTVTFAFSELIRSSTTVVNATTQNAFIADVPIYPSIAQDASTCNVTVILPQNATHIADDFSFNSTLKDQRYYLSHIESPLPKLAREPLQVRFSSVDKDVFACFSLTRLNREITVDANKHVSLSELFVFESRNVFSVSNLRLDIPRDASNVSAFDAEGRKLTPTLLGVEALTYEIPFSLAVNQSKSLKLTYSLSAEDQLVQLNPQTYVLTLDLSKDMRMMPKTFALSIAFPEGAAIQSFPQEAFAIQRGVFQQTLSLTASNITWLQNEQWSITYSYAVFWASFRPTLWATTLVILGSIVAFAWQKPKPAAPVSIILVPRKTLNEFVETYEEKKKILSELDQVKRQALKGKISRRRYKVRKTTLENRLSALSKKLADMRQKVMSGGAKYADMMRQLEVAETELDNVEADMRRIEVLFKRGEITAQTYRQLLEGDLRRQEKATVTIDGIILRLRE